MRDWRRHEDTGNRDWCRVLAVIAALEIWKRLVPERSKLVKKIEIALVILAFIGGAVGLIREAVSPSDEDIIKETVDTVLKKGTVHVKELKVAYEEIGELKEQLTKAVERAMELEESGDVPEAEGIIEELRKSGDLTRLLVVLEKDRDVHKDQLIERNNEIAAVAFLKGDIERASKALDDILKLLPHDKEAINRKGHIHILKGELNEAEDCYQSVLELSKKAKDEECQAIALGNLGEIFRKRGKLDKAEEMHKRALEINEELDLQRGMARDYCNLGMIYYTRGDLDKAEEMHKKSLEIEEKLGLKEGMASTYGNLGAIYEQRGDVAKAREYWEKAVGLYKKIGMPHMVEKTQGWIDDLN